MAHLFCKELKVNVHSVAAAAFIFSTNTPKLEDFLAAAYQAGCSKEIIVFLTQILKLVWSS